VARRLQHLERQAATAERYQRLREEERRLQAELLALRWRTLSEALERRARAIAELENAAEAALADQRHRETRLEEDRTRQQELGEQFNAVQGRFYASGAEIARLEQSVQFQRENRRRREQETAQVERELTAVQQQARQDRERLAELDGTLAGREPELTRLQQDEARCNAAVAAAEDAVQAGQEAWDAFNHQAAEPAQRAQVERTRINHLEQQETQARRRLERLAEEAARLADTRLTEELAELAETEELLLEQVEQERERLALAQGELAAGRATRGDLGRRLDQIKDSLQQARGRRASLETLQEAGSGAESAALRDWLAEQALDRAPRLARQVQVREPWQRAAEAVLGAGLQARCVTSLDAYREALARLPEGPLDLFETQPSHGVAESTGLQAQIMAPWSLASWLRGVDLAQDLDAALRRRSDLAPGQSLVTPEGIQVGPDWLRAPPAAGDGGVLARAAELTRLEETIAGLEQELAALAAAQDASQTRLDQAEAERSQAQTALDRLNQELGRLRADLSGRRARQEQLAQRAEAIASERAELQEQVTEGREIQAEARELLHAALAAMETLADRRTELVAQRDQLRAALEQARGELREVARSSRALGLEVEAARSARAALQTGAGRLAEQLERLQERREELVQAQIEAEAPQAELAQALEQALNVRVAVEHELTEARARVEALDAALREGERARQQAEGAVQAARAELDRARLQQQEVLVRTRTLEEQLKAGGHQPGTLLAELAADADEGGWEEAVEQIAARIQRLGPINLAAIDEFREQSERKTYLDAQHEDISRALETLEEAIRKIDRETRTRFRATFDQVNAGLQALFPKLFGGGHAYLELTGEDLLDTGVGIMARPPGKRNSSIHLLSGGEKALTAVALVFSIFQLNPAPFCMLDEVDAPLDDANVGRFCELVKSLSDQVQFIFITHNKVTMELARQLIGVTMHEPGVSRLVAVDVDEAIRLAAV
jgi:chromosome segregation protein